MSLKAMFKYEPNKEYNFTIQQSIKNEKSQKEDENQKIYKSYDKNLEYMNIKYNTAINSDIVVREFFLLAENKKYRAFLFFIDGMTNSDLINNYVLKPLIMRN